MTPIRSFHSVRRPTKKSTQAVATARSAELSASVTEGRRRLVERIDAEPALSPLAMEHGDCPAVILPLVNEGRTLGVLVTVHRHDGPDDAMIDLLDTLASHACLAFANAVPSATSRRRRPS
jgi:hypothetical protein